MRYPDYLHYCLRRCQDADSSDERGRGRVPCETIRSSIVAQNGPSRTGYVSNIPIVCGAWKGVSCGRLCNSYVPCGGPGPNYDMRAVWTISPGNHWSPVLQDQRKADSGLAI